MSPFGHLNSVVCGWPKVSSCRINGCPHPTILLSVSITVSISAPGTGPMCLEPGRKTNLGGTLPHIPSTPYRGLYFKRLHFSKAATRGPEGVNESLLRLKVVTSRIYSVSKSIIEEFKDNVETATLLQPTYCIKLSNLPMKVFDVRGIMYFQDKNWLWQN